MRRLLIGLVLLTGPGLFFAACTQDPTSATTGTTGSTGVGGAAACGISIGPVDSMRACNVCIQHECCAQGAACAKEADCISCLDNFKPDCGPGPRAVNDCLLLCEPSCSPNWPPTTTSSGNGGSGGTTGSSTSGG